MTLVVGFNTVAQLWAPTSPTAIFTNSGTGQLLVTVIFANKSGASATLWFWKNGTVDPYGILAPIPLGAGYSGVLKRYLTGPGDVLYAQASAASAIALDVTAVVNAL